MSIDALREIINPRGDTAGEVVAIQGGELHVATPCGIALVSDPGGISIGDSVTVRDGRAQPTAAAPAEVYQV